MSTPPTIPGLGRIQDRYVPRPLTQRSAASLRWELANRKPGGCWAKDSNPEQIAALEAELAGRDEQRPAAADEHRCCELSPKGHTTGCWG